MQLDAQDSDNFLKGGKFVSVALSINPPFER